MYLKLRNNLKLLVTLVKNYDSLENCCNLFLLQSFFLSNWKKKRYYNQSLVVNYFNKQSSNKYKDVVY